MAETVKISLVQAEDGRIKWPSRCPRCGATDDLTYVDGRVGVETRNTGETAYAGTFKVVEVAWTAIKFPVCKEHSFQNEVGIRLLEKNLFGYIVRGMIYFAFFFFCSMMYKIVTHKATFSQVFGGDSLALKVYMLFGIVGLLAILWARKSASVWPLYIDKPTGVVTIRFQDQNYARYLNR
jgi:hypothetical protein